LAPFILFPIPDLLNLLDLVNHLFLVILVNFVIACIQKSTVELHFRERAVIARRSAALVIFEN